MSIDDLAAGILRYPNLTSGADSPGGDVTGSFVAALNPSTVWQPGQLPADVRGGPAYGVELTRWRPNISASRSEGDTLLSAWRESMPDIARTWMPNFLRLRVDTPTDAQALRSLRLVDGLLVVPSLDSHGAGRPLEWRWPLSVGVTPGPNADQWLAAVQASEHHGVVFDAELCDPTRTYDIVLVDAQQMPDMPSETQSILGNAASVIVVGESEPAERMLGDLEQLITPPIAVAFAAAPEVWWDTFFHTLTHDVPLDAAVVYAADQHQVDAMVAGPRWGLDITAPAHWFAAVAPTIPELADGLAQLPSWGWDFESDGSTDVSMVVRQAREVGADPYAFVPGQARETNGTPPEEEQGTPVELPEEEQKPPAEPRSLIARVYDDNDAVVESVLPPNRHLVLAVRIAIPEQFDAVAAIPFPTPREDPRPAVELEVLVRSDVWPTQPPPQMITLMKDEVTQPSSWAVFDFTTLGTGSVVSIEVEVRYQGKPLQAAVYACPVRTSAVPGERATLTTYTLSGPNEPTADSRPVDATLDGRGAELRHGDGRAGTVLITDVQQMLDKIEEPVSQVLGVRGAPDSFDDPKIIALLIELARTGTQLRTLLAPLQLGDAKSITINVNPNTKVLPLEMVYEGQPPDPKRAQLCEHIDHPPPAGQVCDQATTRRVCPYAFWGLSRTIARTVWSEGNQARAVGPVSATAAGGPPAYSVLYAATQIADRGSGSPKPSDLVLAAAQAMFTAVTRVTSWRAWRSAVQNRPNLLVVLGHTLVEAGGQITLYIGKRSVISEVDISRAMLGTEQGGRPIVLLVACSSAKLGGPFGTLPGALIANNAGAVIGTLAKIVGPQGATATTHLLTALHDAVGQQAVGDAVASARRSLVKDKHPIGLLLVSHGELDEKAGQ